MKLKLEGCLSFIVVVAMVAFGIFLTYLFALGVVTFVDNISGMKMAEKEKIIIVDTVSTHSADTLNLKELPDEKNI